MDPASSVRVKLSLPLSVHGRTSAITTGLLTITSREECDERPPDYDLLSD